MVWQIRPGLAAEYDRFHASVWPELEAVMREYGARQFVVYRSGETVFAHLEVTDFAEFVARYDSDPIAQRWEAGIEHLFDVPEIDPATGWPAPLVRAWSLDVPTGPDPTERR